MTTDGPCHYCKTQKADRIPVLVMNKIYNRLDDIICVCDDCWTKELKRDRYSFRDYYDKWHKKKTNSNTSGGSGIGGWGYS